MIYNGEMIYNPPGGMKYHEPLSENSLNSLTIDGARIFQMQPGQNFDFTVGILECCYYFMPVATSITWSIDPQKGATIDPEKGYFTVDPSTPNGTIYTIRANVEKGRRIVEAKVYIFTLEANPFVGEWYESIRFKCKSDQTFYPKNQIRRLLFMTNGNFTVTWRPFELRHDYWGSYDFDLKRRTIKLQIKDGVYIPKDMRGSGSFSFDENGGLTLKNIWLGSSQLGDDESLACGHRFYRYRIPVFIR